MRGALRGMSNGFLYIIARRDGCEHVAPTKIGITSPDEKGLNHRLASIRTSCPFEAEIVRSYSFINKQRAREFEQDIHRLFSPLRLRGEWFTIDPVLAVEFIEMELGL
jgi:hypothetical protein